MNIYIAGRVRQGENEIASLARDLKKRGHVITYKWWEKQVKKPFLKHKAESEKLAEQMVKAVQEADVLILFTEDNILGAATEFGIALGDAHKKHEILLIHPPENRQSVFYAHPNVQILANTNNIQKRPWY